MVARWVHTPLETVQFCSLSLINIKNHKNKTSSKTYRNLHTKDASIKLHCIQICKNNLKKKNKAEIILNFR